jgi:predicted ATPase
MAGFTLRNSEEFDAWQSYEASHLRTQYSEALIRLVCGYIWRRDYTAARTCALRLLALDPLSEAAHCYLMQIYAWMDEPAEALRQYAACQTALDELGVAPQSFTNALYEAIKNGIDLPTDNLEIKAAESPPDVPAPAAKPDVLPPNNLPHLLTAFVPRPDETTLIAETLNRVECRLLTLTGIGGIGKTRLALQTAADQVAHFGDGTFFVPLVSVQQSDQAVFAIGNALKIAFKGLQDATDQLIGYVRDKTILLVMDSFEHVLGAATLIDELLVNAPRLKIVVTSRERLDLSGEWIVPVGGMGYPDTAHAPDWDSFSAVQLFIQSVRRVQPRFDPNANREAVVAVCQAVEGIPLSLELAATWAHSFTIAQILQCMENGLDFLVTSARNIPERHRSLRVVFDQSWELCSALEQQVLRQLAVFRSHFRFEAAAAIAGATTDDMAHIIEKSMVRVQDQEHYDIHQLLRQYLLERLVEANEDRATRDRHLAYYLALSDAAAPELRGANQIEWLERLDADHANIRDAVLWALEDGQTDAALRIEGNLWMFWRSRNHSTEALQWIEQTLAQYANVNTTLYANAAYAAGIFSSAQGDYAKAEHYHRQALDIRQDLNDQVGISASLNSLGILAWTRREYDKAQTLLEQSLAIRRAGGNTLGQATTLGNLGVLLVEMNDHPQASRYFEEALVLHKQLDDLQGIALILANLGGLSYLQGDYQQSRAYYEETLEIERRVGRNLNIAEVLRNLSEIAIWNAEYAAARAMLDESLQLCLQVNDKSGVAKTYIKQGWLAYNTDQIAQAMHLAEQGILVLRAIGDRRDLAEALLLKAKCLGKQHPVSGVHAFADCFTEALRLSELIVGAEAALELAQVAVESKQAKWTSDLLAVFSELYQRSNQALLPRMQAQLARIQQQLSAQSVPKIDVSFQRETILQPMSNDEMMARVSTFVGEYNRRIDDR